MQKQFVSQTLEKFQEEEPQSLNKITQVSWNILHENPCRILYFMMLKIRHNIWMV